MKIKKITKKEYEGDVYNLRIKSNDGYNHNYFANNINVSNCHKVKAQTIKESISKCINAERRFGLTGTTPKQGTLDSLTLQAYLGPTVIKVTAKELQQQGTIAQVDIAVVEFEYPDGIKKRFDDISRDMKGEDKSKILKLEQDFVIQYNPRTEIISKIISKIEKNQLVMFHRQKYGKELKKYLEENTDKEVYFIYGEIKKDDRAEIKRLMKTGTNKVLVASFGTLSVGLNIPNIHNIHFTESFKSDIIVRQTIGRGVRLHKDKDKLRLYDYVDCLSTGNKNMLVNHSRVRRTIYNEQGFDYTIKSIKLG